MISHCKLGSGISKDEKNLPRRKEKTTERVMSKRLHPGFELRVSLPTVPSFSSSFFNACVSCGVLGVGGKILSRAWAFDRPSLWEERSVLGSRPLSPRRPFHYPPYLTPPSSIMGTQGGIKRCLLLVGILNEGKEASKQGSNSLSLSLPRPFNGHNTPRR